MLIHCFGKLFFKMPVGFDYTEKVAKHIGHTTLLLIFGPWLVG